MPKAKKRFGQNFLTDTWTIQKILIAINAKKKQQVIEIGPGKGAITRGLISQLGELTVIELDRDLLPYLEKEIANLGILHIINDDVLNIDFQTLQQQQQKIRLVGNLPYNISTPLIFKCLQYQNVIADMHFMLQQEVVDRMAAEPGTKNYSRLTVMINYYCHVEKLFIVPATAFNPQPRVTSAFVKITPRAKKLKCDSLLFSKVVAQAFSQRRKIVQNTLKGLCSVEDLVRAGIEPDLRPQAISMTQYVALVNLLASH